MKLLRCENGPLEGQEVATDEGVYEFEIVMNDWTLEPLKLKYELCSYPAFGEVQQSWRIKDTKKEQE